ncbi:uncharacterized protein (DUF952 family) [Microvirga flocculans]|uniref:Uncharacterized protein (DUF952 family) n=2 Tax=Microvirga flocculans TaxID=217168 RepID=A0A7W6IIG9_9HYPH|nr:uncharacterized protein (DUF952 family) [Microvirga flocculans]
MSNQGCSRSDAEIIGFFMHIIYKICAAAQWREAERCGFFEGAAIDIQDGYLHFSTAAQVRETAARHFAGQDGLLLIAIDADSLGEALRYEPSRGGDLFPHLYAKLPLSAVRWVKPLPLGADGLHVFPDLEP